MEQTYIIVEQIPAMLWGPESDKLMIAVHGNRSSKTDVVIEIVADAAIQKGYRVLSFDLPEHGDRKQELRLCDTQNSVEDLAKIMRYARTRFKCISLFGCSIGAYFSILAYQHEPIEQALFLSPIIDMNRLIQNMMVWFELSEEQLKEEQEIATPINTLYWHDYQYVLRHPVKWDKPAAVLYGANDELCAYEDVKAFVESCKASLAVLEDSEHFFHTERQLNCLRKWLQDNITA